jgi:hypothetical protein
MPAKTSTRSTLLDIVVRLGLRLAPIYTAMSGSNRGCSIKAQEDRISVQAVDSKQLREEFHQCLDDFKERYAEDIEAGKRALDRPDWD